MVWDWVVIVVGYLFAAFALRLLGGFGSAAEAITGWGRRWSEKRIGRLRWLPESYRPQRPTSSS
jgi:hypothetical protein